MRTSNRTVFLLASAIAAAGCSGSDSGAPENVGRASAAVTGTPFYYLRCNDTDWGVDEGSRLKPTADPHLLSISVQVPGGNSDVCSVTEVIATSPDSWGTSQTYWTTQGGASVAVPSSAVLVSKTSEVNFSVGYSAPGAYIATFNTSTNTLSVAPAGALEGRLAQSPGAGVAGTTVTLLGPSGGSLATTLTNANGAYEFVGLAPATYSVSFATAGGPQPAYGLSASSVAIQGQAASIDATCTPSATAPCTAGVSITDPYHQLVIVDPAVTDPTQNPQASNATDGHFSFRYVLETLSGCPNAATNAVCVSNFTKNWLTNISTVQTINGFTVPSRNGQNLILIWPKLADGTTLDMSQALFQLTAIINRTDLHSTGQGEGRLVYALVLGGTRAAMSVIVEFALPSTASLPNRSAWVSAFFTLPNLDSKSAAYACASSTNPSCEFGFNLQTLTDQFVAPGNLIDLRTNEIELSPGEGDTWAWRQLVLSNASGSNELVTAATPETPPPALNGSASVASFVTQNAPGIRSGFASLPASLLGGQAEDISQTSWNFPTFDAPTLHAFSGRTCNGCHVFEPSDPSQTSGPTFHVNPTLAPVGNGQNILSFFETQIEIPRRESFMTNWLSCGGSTTACAPGADVAMMQP